VTPVYDATKPPFSTDFTPNRLGSANFEAFAVFTDNTFAAVPLNYVLQPCGQASYLSLNAPVANLPISVPLFRLRQVLWNGWVDVIQVASYSTRSVPGKGYGRTGGVPSAPHNRPLFEQIEYTTRSNQEKTRMQQPNRVIRAA
jgi:hypothetical protein